MVTNGKIGYWYFIFLAGFTTDGEFNYLRTQGRSRPISVIELIKIARQEARQTGKKLIMEYFKLDSEGK